MKIESAEEETAAKEGEIIQKVILIEAITVVGKFRISVLSLHEFVDEVEGRNGGYQKQC